jgi:FSR family fosmidomycin resistance protein-like MFS transporter
VGPGSDQLGGASRSPRQAAAALAFGHGATDMYMGFLPALLPLIIARLGLSYREAGLVVSVVTLISQLSQPIFGYLGDVAGRRRIAIIAPAVTALCMSWMGLVGSYRALLVVLILGCIGTAAFHPQGAALVGRVVARGRGTAMALFTAGGSFGFGVGSVLIATLVAHLGLARTWLAMPVGLAAVVYVAAAVPRSVESPEQRTVERAQASVPNWIAPLVLLWFVVMLRASTATMFTTFVPVLIERRGESLVLGGWALFGFSIAGALGGFLGSHLSVRFGRRAVTAAGLAVAGPALYLFLHTGGIAAAALLLVTGACVFLALPLNIVMAQELVPRHASTVSGLVMGFAWGIGGLGATGLGALADHWAGSMGEVAGLARAMDLMALAPLLGAVLAAALPTARPAARGR